MEKRTRRRAATLLAAATLMVLPATAAVAAEEEQPDGPQICFDLRLSLFGNSVGEAFCLPS